MKTESKRSVNLTMNSYRFCWKWCRTKETGSLWSI